MRDWGVSVQGMKKISRKRGLGIVFCLLCGACDTVPTAFNVGDPPAEAAPFSVHGEAFWARRPEF